MCKTKRRRRVACGSSCINILTSGLLVPLLTSFPMTGWAAQGDRNPAPTLMELVRDGVANPYVPNEQDIDWEVGSSPETEQIFSLYEMVVKELVSFRDEHRDEIVAELQAEFERVKQQTSRRRGVKDADIENVEREIRELEEELLSDERVRQLVSERLIAAIDRDQVHKKLTDRFGREVAEGEINSVGSNGKRVLFSKIVVTGTGRCSLFFDQSTYDPTSEHLQRYINIQRLRRPVDVYLVAGGEVADQIVFEKAKNLSEWWQIYRGAAFMMPTAEKTVWGLTLGGAAQTNLVLLAAQAAEVLGVEHIDPRKTLIMAAVTMLYGGGRGVFSDSFRFWEQIGPPVSQMGKRVMFGATAKYLYVGLVGSLLMDQTMAEIFFGAGALMMHSNVWANNFLSNFARNGWVHLRYLLTDGLRLAIGSVQGTSLPRSQVVDFLSYMPSFISSKADLLSSATAVKVRLNGEDGQPIEVLPADQAKGDFISRFSNGHGGTGVDVLLTNGRMLLLACAVVGYAVALSLPRMLLHKAKERFSAQRTIENERKMHQLEHYVDNQNKKWREHFARIFRPVLHPVATARDVKNMCLGVFW